MTRTPHVPAPPTETLTGRWTIERAVRNEITTVRTGSGPVEMRLWGLTVRHVESQALEVVLYRARPATTFRAGQEICGRVETTREGDMFRRDPPAIRPED